MICRQRTHLKTIPTPALQPAPIATTTVTTQVKPPNAWLMPWILQKERECYRTLLADLIQTNVPGYQKFLRMPPTFFDIITIHNHIKKSVTNFRNPLEVGLKLTITPGSKFKKLLEPVLLQIFNHSPIHSFCFLCVFGGYVFGVG